MKRISLAIAVAIVLAQAMGGEASAAQGTGCLPTTGTVSGLTFAQKVNDANAAFISSNSGASAPTTDCSGAPVRGQVWLDTSVAPSVLRKYDGTNWVAIGAIDSVNHVWSPPVGGGAASITANTTTDICASPSAMQIVTGTTAITSFGAGCPVGVRKTLMFTSATPLTYNATSMILPALRDFTAAAGDMAEALHLGNGNWRVRIDKIDGSSVSNPAVALGTIQFGIYGSLPAKSVYGFGQALSRATYSDFFLATTRAQTATLTSGSATITSVANTGGFGPGMPVEGIGLQVGTKIVSVTSSTITLDKTAIETGSRTVRVFPSGYGSGGDSTTVGVPDCMGKVLAGREGLTGGGSNWLLAGSTVIGNVQGSPTASLGVSNLPPYTPSGNVAIFDPGHAHAYSTPAFASGLMQNGGGTGTNGNTNNITNASLSFISAAFSGNAQGGTSVPFSVVQPTLIAECVVAVLP